MTVTLRPAEPADGRAIAEVHRTTWAATYTRWIPDVVDDYDLDQASAAWSRGATAEGRHLVVAVHDGVVAGFAASGPARGDDAGDGVGSGDGSGSGNDVGELYAIYVSPPLHGQGIGQALMADTLGWLAGAGYRECILWVAAPSTRSRHFYERAGFALDEGATDEWRGLATVRYRRPLSPLGPLSPLSPLSPLGPLGPLTGSP
jgi:GNAT superfamily N-acetyltransferase